MNSILEEQNQIFEVLKALNDGYETGDFDDFFPMLAPDCLLKSQWVMTPNEGYDAVVSYFTEKGKTLKKAKAFPSCTLVELIRNQSPKIKANAAINADAPKQTMLSLMHTPGKLCLLMEQKLNGENIGVIVDVKLNENGYVRRIDLCMPELFHYRPFYVCASAYPATKKENAKDDEDEYEEDDTHRIRLSKHYFKDLVLFMFCVGVGFSEWDDLNIPMETWCKALQYWERFVNADSFDEALETAAGIDYATNSVQSPELSRFIGQKGGQIWKTRVSSQERLAYLKEWTDLYKDKFTFVNTYGF